jgi:hypothetical protein
MLLLLGAPGASRAAEASPADSPPLSRSDDEFLDDVSRRAFGYFLEQADASTGLVFDRARADGARPTGASGNVASTAATGFGLSALAIGARRGWIDAPAPGNG